MKENRIMPVFGNSFLSMYEKEGYALVSGVLTQKDLDPLRSVIERAVDDLAHKLKSEGKIASLFENEPFERRMAAMFEGTGTGFRNWDPVIFTKELYDLICHPGILAMLEPLIGPNIMFNGDYHLRPKLPESHMTAFPWHQDSQYYGKQTEHMHIVTLTVALVDTDEENGCLWFIPGSHRWGYVEAVKGEDMNMRPLEDVEARGTAVPALMKTADLMPFHNLTFHCSKLNTSKKVRWTLDLRYSASLGSKPMTKEEQEAYEYLLPRFPALGYVNYIVQGIGGRTPWEEVQKQYRALKDK